MADLVLPHQVLGLGHRVVLAAGEGVPAEAVGITLGQSARPHLIEDAGPQRAVV